MTINNFTQEELKKVIKSLFVEKKKVKELQKKIEGSVSTKRKFSKFLIFKRFSIGNDYEELKVAYSKLEHEYELVKNPLGTKKLEEVNNNEYATEIVQLRLENRAKEEAYENLLSAAYVKMRDFSTRHASLVEEHEQLQTELQNVKVQLEERNTEIRKAWQHLAKKIREVTILRDQVDQEKKANVASTPD